MSRLIDADALMESLKESADRAKKWYEDCKTYDSAMIDRAEQAIMTFNECGLRIQNAPTVDAVEVVRCRDCIRFRPDDVWGWCTVSGKMRCKDFCSYGVRKDGEQHGR